MSWNGFTTPRAETVLHAPAAETSLSFLVSPPEDPDALKGGKDTAEPTIAEADSDSGEDEYGLEPDDDGDVAGASSSGMFRPMSPDVNADVLRTSRTPSALASLALLGSVPKQNSGSILAQHMNPPSSLLKGLDATPGEYQQMDEKAVTAKFRAAHGLPEEPVALSKEDEIYMKNQLLRMDQMYAENEIRIQSLDSELSEAKQTVIKLTMRLRNAMEANKLKKRKRDGEGDEACNQMMGGAGIQTWNVPPATSQAGTYPVGVIPDMTGALLRAPAMGGAPGVPMLMTSMAQRQGMLFPQWAPGMAVPPMAAGLPVPQPVGSDAAGGGAPPIPPLLTRGPRPLAGGQLAAGGASFPMVPNLNPRNPLVLPVVPVPGGGQTVPAVSGAAPILITGQVRGPALGSASAAAPASGPPAQTPIAVVAAPVQAPQGRAQAPQAAAQPTPAHASAPPAPASEPKPSASAPTSTAVAG